MDQKVDIYLGRVLHVIDPDNFWMQIGTNESFAEFMQLELNLEEYCRFHGNTVNDIEQICDGDVVLVDCMENSKVWRRGQVSRVDRVQRCADVVYIDYGFTEIVDEMRLCNNVPEEYFELPSQAILCKLAGIQPIARSWTTRATNVFKDMTVNSIFHTVIMNSCYRPIKVVLYPQDGEGRSLSNEMIVQELALPVGEEVAEYFTDAADFYMQNMEAQYEEETSEWPIEVTSQYTDMRYESEIASSSQEEENDLILQESPEVPPSPEYIPAFDFARLHHTREADTKKMQEKTAEQTRIQLAKEQELIMKEFKECADQANLAGYGDPDDTSNINNSNLQQQDYPINSNQKIHGQAVLQSTSGNHFGYEKGPMVEVEEKNHQIVERLSPQNRGGQLPLKRYSRMRAREKVNKPSIEEKIEQLNTVTIKPSERTEVNASSQESSNGANNQSKQGANLNLALESQVIDKRLLDSAIEFNKRPKGRGRGRGSPRGSFSKDSNKNSEENSSPLTVSSQENFEDAEKPKTKVKITSLWHKSSTGETNHMDAVRKDLPDLIRSLHKIFADSEKDSTQASRARLQTLFNTDLFLYLNKEQLGDVLFTLLNRAVRYYGELQDVLLEIVEILRVTSDFEECFIDTIKKMEAMYIKIQTRGKAFHLPCSKLFGHIFNMSIHWDCRDMVHEVILGALDKWILFNKMAQQIGQDMLQIIYLESFEAVWDVAKVIYSNLYPDKKERLLRECRDKILNGDISRKVRSQMLDIYISKLIIQIDSSKSDMETQTDISAPVVYTKGTQTTVISSKVKANAHKLKELESSSNLAVDSEQKDWPSLGNPRVPDWTSKILETLESPGPRDKSGEHRMLPGRVPEILMTPQSFNEKVIPNLKQNTDAECKTSELRGRKPSDKLKSFRVESSKKMSQHPVYNQKHYALSSGQLRPSVNKTSDSSPIFLSAVWNPSRIESQGSVYNSPDPGSSCQSRLRPSVPTSTPFFPSAHVVSDLPIKNRQTKSLLEIGEEWLSSTNSSSSVKQGDAKESKHQLKPENPSDKVEESPSEEPMKEKMFDWFDMEETKDEKDALFTESKDSYKAAEVPVKEEYDWFDLEPKEMVKDTSEHSPIVTTSSSSKQAKDSAKPAPKEIDWFDAGDEDEDDDTGYDFDWETDYSQDENSMDNMRKDTVTNCSTDTADDSESSDKPKSFNRYDPSNCEAPRWVPGRRKCTLCGADNHLIYDCPEKHNKNFFL